jgi:hypothetical protein
MNKIPDLRMAIVVFYITLYNLAIVKKHNKTIVFYSVTVYSLFGLWLLQLINTKSFGVNFFTLPTQNRLTGNAIFSPKLLCKPPFPLHLAISIAPHSLNSLASFYLLYCAVDRVFKLLVISGTNIRKSATAFPYCGMFSIAHQSPRHFYSHVWQFYDHHTSTNLSTDRGDFLYEGNQPTILGDRDPKGKYVCSNWMPH